MGNVLFTSVRDAGRPQVVLLFFIASLLLLLTGCDVAEVESSSGSNSSSSNLLGNHRYFTREARIEFSQGVNRQAVRAQDNPYFVRQGLSRPEIDFEGARPLLLDGEAGHFLAYTPEKPENPTFSGVSGEFTPLGAVVKRLTTKISGLPVSGV